MSVYGLQTAANISIQRFKLGDDSVFLEWSKVSTFETRWLNWFDWRRRVVSGKIYRQLHVTGFQCEFTFNPKNPKAEYFVSELNEEFIKREWSCERRVFLLRSLPKVSPSEQCHQTTNPKSKTAITHENWMMSISLTTMLFNLFSLLIADLFVFFNFVRFFGWSIASMSTPNVKHLLTQVLLKIVIFKGPDDSFKVGHVLGLGQVKRKF